MKNYSRHMVDAAGDGFGVTAEDAQVKLRGDNDNENVVADLWLTAPQALRLARVLTKAAERAYAQEQEAHECL